MTPLPLGSRIPVGVLGATGTVGQKFLTLLAEHPWFEVAAVMASERSAGRPYRDAVRWVQPGPIPASYADLEVTTCVPSGDLPLVFSALDAAVAGPIEETFARAGALVVSNAGSHRMDADVPLLVPEVNADHIDLARTQSFGGGAILTNPNCSTIGLVLALEPLRAAFGVERVHVVSLQALSGAGLPGVPSIEIIDNVIPHIGGEEAKIESESHKIFGQLESGAVTAADLTVSATCTRVPVIDGHTLCVSVALGRDAETRELIEAWNGFEAEPQRLTLPSAPRRPVVYLDALDAPQPRLHRDYENGMGVTVGRLRPCNLLDYKFVTLSHNTVRGAAGGSILVAELAVAKQLIRLDDAPKAHGSR